MARNCNVVVGCLYRLAASYGCPKRKNRRGQAAFFEGANAEPANQDRARRPACLPAERALALIAFSSAQREHIEGWVQGLNLRAGPSIAWMRMPVINDPGSHASAVSSGQT